MLILFILFIFLIFLSLWGKDEEAFKNIEQNKIWTYMESIFFERDPYKIWKLNIPWLGLESNISYNAVCHKITEECWKVNALIVKKDLLYAYREEEFFVFTPDNIRLYSLYELSGLSEAQKEILLDLKENPRFTFE